MPGLRKFVVFKVLICIGCLQGVVHPVNAQNNSLDNQVLVELMEHRSPGATEYHRAISNSTQYISLAVPATLLCAGAISGDKHTLKNGWYITKSLILSSLVTYGLKYSINRQRPFQKNSFIIPEAYANSPSFPSGHTSEAFSVATSISIAYPKWYVIVPASLWAGSVGYSRMYLGVHYPTDIIAGAVVGTVSAWLTWKASKWLQGKKKQTVRPYY